MTLCLVRAVRQGPLDPPPAPLVPVRPSLKFISAAPRDQRGNRFGDPASAGARWCCGFRQGLVIGQRSGPANASTALRWIGDLAAATNLFGAVRHIG
jgi:hypothetical protein